MRMRVEFTLTMPGRGSWNGAWSGAGNNYAIVRSLTEKRLEELGIPGASWTHSWSDGWCAQVFARVLGKGERRSKSDGFAGYDWMVDNIIRWGSTECRHDMLPPDPDGWKRCRLCHMSKRVEGDEDDGNQ